MRVHVVSRGVEEREAHTMGQQWMVLYRVKGAMRLAAVMRQAGEATGDRVGMAVSAGSVRLHAGGNTHALPLAAGDLSGSGHVAVTRAALTEMTAALEALGRKHAWVEITRRGVVFTCTRGDVVGRWPVHQEPNGSGGTGNVADVDAPESLAAERQRIVAEGGDVTAIDARIAATAPILPSADMAHASTAAIDAALMEGERAAGRARTQPRGPIHTTLPDRPGNGVSRAWVRIIRGVPYAFTAVTMPDGERRYVVRRYNGYGDGTAESRAIGMRFDCAWSPVHSITVRPESDWVDTLTAVGQAESVVPNPHYLCATEGAPVCPTGEHSAPESALLAPFPITLTVTMTAMPDGMGFDSRCTRSEVIEYGTADVVQWLLGELTSARFNGRVSAPIVNGQTMDADGEVRKVDVPARCDWQTLNAIMEFDHVIRVHRDGSVTDEPGTSAPEAWDGEVSEGWTLLNGYSGQCGYSGPIMHASEYIGGRMARDILAEPGVYVAILDYPSDDPEPTGWAVAQLNASVVPESASYVCGYCGGAATPGDTPGSYVHAFDGERVTGNPGDYVTGRHNRAGTPILPGDLHEAESV